MKLALLAVAALFLSLSQARADCTSDLASFVSLCSGQNPLLTNSARGIKNAVGNPSFCRQIGFQKIDRTAYLFDGESVAIQENKSCKLNYVNLPARMLEAKVMAGRLIMLGRNKKLYVMDRTKNIFEITKPSGAPFDEIKDIKIENEDLIVDHERSGGFILSLDQLDSLLNSSNAIKTITLFE